jgi:hypothetical protein
MTSRITAIGGKPVPLAEPKKAHVKQEKKGSDLAQLDNKPKVTEKRAEAQNVRGAKPSEAWSKLPGGTMWMGFGK